MDKKYYSQKHKKYNSKNYGSNYYRRKRSSAKRYTANKRKSSKEKSPFLMRLNISLAITILVIGVYKLNSDLSVFLSAAYKDLTQNNISFEEIENEFNIFSSLKNLQVFSSGDNQIVLDKSIADYIANTEDTYVINNTPAVSK